MLTVHRLLFHMEVYVDWAGLRKLVDLQQDRQYIFIPTHKVDPTAVDQRWLFHMLQAVHVPQY